MIERGHNGYTLTCDICGHEIKPFDDFKEAVQYKKDNGWRSTKYRTATEDMWQDLCPECQE